MLESTASTHTGPAGEHTPLINYHKYLNALENEDHPSAEQIMAVMVSRDRVQEWLSPQLGVEIPSKIMHLDGRLKHQAEKLDDLDLCRDTIQPDKSHWWWWLEKPSAITATLEANGLPTGLANGLNTEVNNAQRDRWDWLWNLGTVTCLVISAGLMGQTAKAFSEEGFDLLGTVSTIGQGAGLAIVARGVLTDEGKKKVKNFLHNVNIPEDLHAEATFAGSTAMLVASVGLFTNLPNIGNLYYNWGQRQEAHENWDKALESYDRAARFNPQNSDITLTKGKLHEKLGNFDEAIATYETEASLGKAEFNNALARVLMVKGLQQKNWRPPLRKRALSEIELLLDRVDRSIPDNALEHKDVEGFLLQTDLRVNQVMYEFSKINWSTIDISGDESDTSFKLISAIAALGSPAADAQTNFNAGTFDPADFERATCYHHSLIDMFRLAISQSDYWLLYDPLAMSVNFGNTYAHAEKAKYACAEITGWSADSETLNDGKFLTTLGQNIRRRLHDNWDWRNDPFPAFSWLLTTRQQFDSAGDISPISSSFIVSDKTLWDTLGKQLKTQLNEALKESDLSHTSQEEEIVLRVIMTDQGTIAEHFVYADFAADKLFIFFNLLSLSWQQEERDWLAAIEGLEELDNDQQFADFKVVIHPNKKEVEVLDWQSAYPGSLTHFEQPLKGLSPVEYTESSLDSTAEKTILADILFERMYAHIDSVYDDNNSLFGTVLEDPWEYEVMMAADGRVASIRPLNQAAEENLHRTHLSRVEADPTATALPTTAMKVSFKNSETYQVVPLIN